MDRGNVLSGAPFKAAVLSAVIFLGAFVSTGVSAYFYIQRSTFDDLRAQITDEHLFLKQIHDTGGVAALVRAVGNLETPVPLEPRAIGVFGDQGIRLAGNVRRLPDTTGWHRQTLTISNPGASQADQVSEYYVDIETLDQVTLVVGRDLNFLTTTEATALRALSAVAVLVVLSILGGGYILSQQSLSKLVQIEQTLDRVSQGDTGARLPVTERNDQIDRIAGRMNAHLDRLSQLLVITRSSAAAIAHDLRTPLSRAFLGLDTALDQLDRAQDPRTAIESSQDELTRLNGIVNTILRIARIDAKGDQSSFVPVDLAALLRDLAETFSALAEENGQSFALRCPPEGRFEILGDDQMLRQMLVNLIQNGLTHCPAGTALSIELVHGTEGVVLTVADTGPGIPEHERAQVFDPFFRGDRARTSPGSGLGLALVKSIAERHAAAITLSDNAPGVRIRVSFPKI